MSGKTLPVTGGCLCGAVRYECDDSPDRAFCCHCSTCQKHASGPMMELFFVPADKFRIVSGKVKTYDSSETGRRNFCPTCGTPIAFHRSTRPEVVSVMGGSLDNPSLFRPLHHLWTESDQAWFHEEGIPSHEKHFPEYALRDLLTFED